MKSVLIVEGNYQYTQMFIEIGFKIVDNISKADLVCFTGGSDVSPELYGDVKHPQTFSNYLRDRREERIYEACLKSNTPMVGICRGGQFLNVMNGGRMYQHVTEHCKDHVMFVRDNEYEGYEIIVSSTHHQMMMPAKEAIIKAVAYEAGDREWYASDVFHKDTSNEDIEVVLYQNTRSLCFQPHPEFDGYPEMRKYFTSLVTELIGE